VLEFDINQYFNTMDPLGDQCASPWPHMGYRDNVNWIGFPPAWCNPVNIPGTPHPGDGAHLDNKLLYHAITLNGVKHVIDRY